MNLIEALKKHVRVRRDHWELWCVDRDGPLRVCWMNGPNAKVNLVFSDLLADDWVAVEESLTFQEAASKYKTFWRTGPTVKITYNWLNGSLHSNGHLSYESFTAKDWTGENE